MMKRLYSSLFVVLTACAASGQQADYQKLSPWVRQAVVIEQHVQKQQPVSQRASASQKRTLTAFIQTNDDEVLKKHGCRSFARIDDIVIASIPLENIARLSHEAAIRRIEASESCHTTMDTVPIVTNMLPIYTASAQHPAFTGKGVVVGIMDVGFDLTQPNFYDSTLKKYRIKAFWDQLSKDTIGSTFPVGRDFIGEEAILAQGCAIDGKTQTHGTHTTGITAGSGYNSPYRGIAYESDLCLVANAVTQDTIYIDEKDYYKYTSATDALGFKYIFDYADSQGMPCVASFSEGYSPYLDEEDQLYAEFLDKLVTPGHILVVSAGNENQAQTYAEKPQGTASAGSFIRNYKKNGSYRIQASGPMILNIYGYAPNGQLQKVVSIPSTDERLKTALNDTLFIQDDTCAVSISSYPSAFSDDTIFLLHLSANRNLNDIGYIALTAEGADSRVEFYGSSSNPFKNREEIDPRWTAASYGHNILGPGCFKAAICVGATTWRTTFKNYKGEEQQSSNQTYGKRMTESSTGPSMNGLLKPEVTAPGYDVISSYSSYYAENNPEAWDITNNLVDIFQHQGRSYAWASCSGTSMACPVVAGTIALWLQAKPTLSREEILDVFSRTCRHLDDGLSYPNNEYGYGQIDGYAGLLDILGASSIQGLSQHQPEEVAITACNGQLHLSFAHRPTAPVTVCIYTLKGIIQHREQVMPTGTEATITLPAMSAGVYAVQLTSSNARQTGSQLIRL